MKADQKTQTKVTLTLRGMFEAYAKRDLNGVLAFWASDPDVAMIGSGADERSVGINQFAKIIMRDWSQSDTAKVNLKGIAVSSAGTVAWFASDVIFNVKSGAEKFEFSGRLTGVLEKRGDLCLLVQMHFSVPSSEQAQGKSWPEPQPTK
jgi:ketosteroid isomerase-like protein